MSELNNAKSDLLKSYLKKNSRVPAVKVSSSGGRGAEDAGIVIEALSENWTTV